MRNRLWQLFQSQTGLTYFDKSTFVLDWSYFNFW